jgi:DNA polymerase elongation subunit (family B)
MNKDLIFQIIDWQEYNERIDIELETIDYKTKKPRIIHPTRYFINLYGRTQDEKSVILRVENFKPYFFIELPEDWKTSNIEAFITLLNDHLSRKKTNATN